MNVKMTTRPNTLNLPPVNCYTVLVVDDLPANRILLRKALQKAGYAVAEAHHGREAVELIAGGTVSPDLIITDIEMPVMDGLTLMTTIRQSNSPFSTLPILAGSGNADEEMCQSAFRAGANAFIAKPFDLGELREKVAACLTATNESALHLATRERSASSEPLKIASETQEA